MTRKDWLTACMVAVGVAVLTVTLMAPPTCWAEEPALVTVPALPSVQLSIPSIHAQVSASATPDPGHAVKVTLAVTLSSGSQVKEVPVTITVRSTTMNMMSRVMPASKQVAQVQATVPIGPDGRGTALVELPLTWAATKPAQQAETTNTQNSTPFTEQVTRYQMELSSTLGGQAATNELMTVNRIGINEVVNVPVQIIPSTPAP